MLHDASGCWCFYFCRQLSWSASDFKMPLLWRAIAHLSVQSFYVSGCPPHPWVWEGARDLGWVETQKLRFSSLALSSLGVFPPSMVTMVIPGSVGFLLLPARIIVGFLLELQPLQLRPPLGQNHRKLGIYWAITFDSLPKCAKFGLQSPQVVAFCMLSRVITVIYRGLFGTHSFITEVELPNSVFKNLSILLNFTMIFMGWLNHQSNSSS